MEKVKQDQKSNTIGILGICLGLIPIVGIILGIVSLVKQEKTSALGIIAISEGVIFLVVNVLLL